MKGFCYSLTGLSLRNMKNIYNTNLSCVPLVFLDGQKTSSPENSILEEHSAQLTEASNGWQVLGICYLFRMTSLFYSCRRLNHSQSTFVTLSYLQLRRIGRGLICLPLLLLYLSWMVIPPDMHQLHWKPSGIITSSFTCYHPILPKPPNP